MNQYITPLIVLIVIGAILFLVDRVPQLDGTVKLIIKVVACVLLLIYAIKFLAGMV
jgi:type III secretory pathway component EscS